MATFYHNSIGQINPSCNLKITPRNSQVKSRICYAVSEVQVQTLKGFRDIPPEEALKRGRVVSLLKSVFKSYGFVPLETPTLEYAEILEGKYGSEADKLIYKFKDRGGRMVALRYDQTIPLARYVAQNRRSLVFPFKRYQIASVFRAEKPQAGRLREFTQIDIDTVGTSSTLADAEIVATTITALQLLGVPDFKVMINDRAIFGNLPLGAIQTLDKLEKIGREATIAELDRKGFDGRKVLKEAAAKEPTAALKEIFRFLEQFGFDRKLWEFDPLLARGLDYYTGAIFEVKISKQKTSLAGGGRYDNLIGIFLGEKIPATGISFGLDRLMAVVPEKTYRDIPFQPRVLVTVFSPELLNYSIRLFDQVQGQGIETELYLDPTAKLDKQLKYADRKGIPLVLIVGPEEARANRVTLKNLKERTQQTLPMELALKNLAQ